MGAAGQFTPPTLSTLHPPTHTSFALISESLIQMTHLAVATWARPQKLVVTTPILCVLMGMTALAFEVGFPVRNYLYTPRDCWAAKCADRPLLQFRPVLKHLVPRIRNPIADGT